MGILRRLKEAAFGSTPQPQAAFMRANQSPFFHNWNPSLRETRDDVAESYQQAAARAIDAAQNSGWIAGAIDQSIAVTMGTGLRLAARPDRIALGWDAKQANDWSEIVERRWAIWSETPVECDAAGKMTVGQMTDAVLRGYYSHGEALALLPYIRRPISQSRTKVKLLPPTRLVQDTNGLARMFQGVSVDEHGLPIAYRISKQNERDPFALGGEAVDFRARDGAGRPQVLHIFEGREGQMRGITPFAPALRIVRQYDQLSDATLQSALLQVIFAATFESAAPTEEVLRALRDEGEQGAADGNIEDYFGARAAWYQNTKIDLGGASRIAHLFPGDKLEFKRSEHPNSTYEAFAKFLLREVGRCVGLTFEQLTGDYSNATYSSVRMSSSELWPIVMRRRNNIAARFVQSVYEAWIEEEIENGFIPFPSGLLGFIAHRPAAVLANWRGPAKPQADDLKTAKAHQVYVGMRVMSRERVADDLGYDFGDEIERIAREKEIAEDLGVTLVDDVDVAGAEVDKIERAPAMGDA